MNSQTIIALHDSCCQQWKENDLSLRLSNAEGLIEKNHAFNFQLWQAEDKARRDDLGFEHVYQAKRAIDGFNQQRNNAMEEMDQFCFEQAGTLHAQSDAPIHSETPGMMIDRLSILALKIYHMAIQAQRPEAGGTHQKQCQQKLDVLKKQREILAHCLDSLLEEAKQGKRRFIIYHQFKMYNDTSLNPELYLNKTASLR